MRSLTVGVLNLNVASLTIDVLDKVALLSKAGWDTQLIVVDNGSTDDEVKCLTDWFLANKGQFAEVLFIAASHNLGVNGGRNVILKLAAGEAILILDNDVVLPANSDWLNTLWQRLETDPKVAIVGPMLVFTDYPGVIQAAGIGLTDSGRVGYLHRADPVESVPAVPVQVVATPAACWLLRTEAQQSVGLFSEDYYPMQYEDVDFCLRLGLEGWKIICDRSVRITHIGNVTTRNLPDHSFARLTVRNAMRFREKWASVLPQIATIRDEEIYWGPIPRPADGG
ncbi:MAG TPA: glycosyltransferase [Anaerolineae bacterium]|nr:glycosyltransferase [Anaerolineae bacterium]